MSFGVLSLPYDLPASPVCSPPPLHCLTPPNSFLSMVHGNDFLINPVSYGVHPCSDAGAWSSMSMWDAFRLVIVRHTD